MTSEDYLTRVRPQVRLGLWVWAAVLGVSVCFFPLVSSGRFLVLGACAAAAVIITGCLLRAAALARPLVLVVQTAVLVVWTTAFFAGDDAFLRVVPTPASVADVEQMVRATFTHVQQFSAPVPRLDALDVVLGIGVGILAVVADLVACSLRRPALVGLVFLGVYVVPVSLLSGQVGVMTFVPGALGYVFLLAAAERERVVGWGGHLADLDRDADPDERRLRGAGLAVVGRRVGFGAVVCAAILPMVIPTFPVRLFGSGGQLSGNTSGSSDVVNVDNPIIDMRRNLTRQSESVLVRVESDGPPPSYLRLTALTELTEFGWTPGERERSTIDPERSVPLPPGQTDPVQTREGTYKVSLASLFHSRWLPVMYAPVSLKAEGDWRIDRDTLDIVAATVGHDVAGDRYTFTSAVARPTEEQLREALPVGPSLDEQRAVPSEIPEVVLEQARRVTAGADNDYERAMLLQRWFRDTGNFTYDISPRGGNGLETIASFVTDDRNGYCEQFASAMAIMARGLGIPARVSVGFLEPERDGGAYVFRGTDMHAWPELYFDGVGWVRFEPTPGGSDYEAASFASGSPANGQDETVAPGSEDAQVRPDGEQKSDGEAGSAAGTTTGSSGGFLTFVWVGLLVIATALAPRGARQLRTRRRWAHADSPAERAETAWAELRDSSVDLGAPWPHGATPRAAGRDLRRQIGPDRHDELAAIVDAVERARYAPTCDATSLRQEVDAVVAAMATRRGRRSRFLATWLPRSLAVRRSATHHEPGQDLLAVRG